MACRFKQYSKTHRRATRVRQFLGTCSDAATGSHFGFQLLVSRASYSVLERECLPRSWNRKQPSLGAEKQNRSVDRLAMRCTKQKREQAPTAARCCRFGSSAPAARCPSQCPRTMLARRAADGGQSDN